jgi:nucleoid-associated protein EbfC
MFGNKNMEEMMSQLQNMQGAVEDSKKRLETIYVKGDALDGKIRFILDGNRNLKELHIDDDIFNAKNKEELIAEMISAFNTAIENANHVNENELKSTAFNMFPGMGK